MDSLLWLFRLLKSGAASLSTDGTQALHLAVGRKRIDFNVMDKELLMDLLKTTDAKEKSLLEHLRTLKRIAQKLKTAEFTLTVSYQGSLLLTLGSEAKPTFSQILTRTDAIELNDLKQLMLVFFGRAD